MRKFEVTKLITSGPLKGTFSYEIITVTVNIEVGLINKPSNFGPGFEIIKSHELLLERS